VLDLFGLTITVLNLKPKQNKMTGRLCPEVLSTKLLGTLTQKGQDVSACSGSLWSFAKGI
jgi:hypothetical protein